jgi:two-component system, NarL family, invasion response regulator UvrY
MLSIFIADDHAIVRQGLKQILSTDSDMIVVGETGNGEEVSAMVQLLKPDVVVLDISMPGKNGLDVLKELKRKHPELPILVLSMHSEDQFAIRCLKAGAAGYVTKESAPEELVGALRKVYKGTKYVSPELAEKLAVRIERDRSDQPHEALSDREYQVLRLIAFGKTVGQISQELSLSVKTVSTYRVRILEKMNMKTNAELTRYAIQHNLDY